MIYLFSDPGMEIFRRYCDAETLFAFDYDGTLTEIVADPEKATTSRDVESSLYQLSELAPTAVISGRGLRDLKERFDSEKLFLVGNHGIEGLTFSDDFDFKVISSGWVDQLAQLFLRYDISDILIEDKLYSLSIHYRMAKTPLEARDGILKTVQQLTPAPRIIYGDHVVNLVPQGAPHKGHALLDLVKKSKAKRVVFIGDDQTDEDVFGLDEPNLLSIKVRSPLPAPVPTRAPYFIHSQSEMLPLLQKIVQTLKG